MSKLNQLIEWMEERLNILNNDILTYQHGQVTKLNYEEILAKAKSLQSEDGWIGLEDRLPEDNQPTPIEPNQTEAEKGSLRKIATEIMDKEYSFFTPDTRKKMVLSFCNGYSLARKQVIEKIEGWAKENTESVENQSGDRGGAIWTSELLTYLQTLKK